MVMIRICRIYGVNYLTVKRYTDKDAGHLFSLCIEYLEWHMMKKTWRKKLKS